MKAKVRKPDPTITLILTATEVSNLLYTWRNCRVQIECTWEQLSSVLQRALEEANK